MTVTMDIDKITMPVIYTHTPPNKAKINNHMMYFMENRTFRKNIIVTQKGMLIDGYCDYIVAVVCGIKSVECELNTKKIRYELGKKNRSINNRPQKRKILYERQGGKCAICGKQLHIDMDGDKESYLTFDHIIPVCRGGSNGLMNLQGLCRKCNKLKSDKME